MAFTEEIKKQARKKSAFACCVCRSHNISVEVHHIISEGNGGPDTLENAATLCPTCHSNFGDNSKKITRIKEMRDSWYETVETMYKPKDLEILESLSTKLKDIQGNLPTIKEDLKKFLNLKINEITPHNAGLVISNISTSAMTSSTPVWKKVSELENQNNELRTKLEFKNSLTFRNGVLWSANDREPFCSRCWEADNKAIHMHPGWNPAFYSCPNCNAQAVKAKPELDRPLTNIYRDPRNSNK